MTLKLECDLDFKTLYFDNILASGFNDTMWYVSIHITTKNATITRYCVPGRLDRYSFTWVPGNDCGLGSRLTYFTDTETPLANAVKQVQKDLKKKQVKKLIKEALTKVPNSYFNRLLEALR